MIQQQHCQTHLGKMRGESVKARFPDWVATQKLALAARNHEFESSFPSGELCGDHEVCCLIHATRCTASSPREGHIGNHRRRDGLASLWVDVCLDGNDGELRVWGGGDASWDASGCDARHVDTDQF